MRARTANHVIESDKSAIKLRIDTNTVCSWVRNLPSYAQENRMKRKPPKSNSELIHKVKELEKKIKLKNKIIEEERTKVEILKNPCTSLCNPKAKCAAIHEKKTEYRISEMCKALGISNSTYYKWVKRKEYKIRK